MRTPDFRPLAEYHIIINHSVLDIRYNETIMAKQIIRMEERTVEDPLTGRKVRVTQGVVDAGDVSSTSAVSGVSMEGKPLPVGPLNEEWVRQTDQYLISKGWVKLGMNERGYAIWEDPTTQNQESRMVAGPRLPVAGGEFIVVHQLQVPSGKWDRTTEEAMVLQRSRDRAGETIEDTIKRKEQELRELKAALARTQAREAKDTKEVSNTPLPQ